MIAAVRDVLDASMSWMDRLWDDDAALLWAVRHDRHLVRETAWYALGLLERGSDGGRAARALSAVLANQFPMDGTPFEGTFRRAPEEAAPPDDPKMWMHYDPNWRQFIGTTFAVIVDQHGEALPSGLVDDLRASIADCVEGEPDDRVAPTYANIALMKAWLDAWAGRTVEADSLARGTYQHFDRHGAFLEYNSPTYYGIDLWALALWRTSTPTLRQLGADMESRLWRDIARFYHAGLRTMCGPFDRAYGMDMTAHATPLGLVIWTIAGRELAPFPDTSGRFHHPHDFCFGPLAAAVLSVVPEDVLPHLLEFQVEREIAQTISDDPLRTVTAWLGPHAMIGAHSGPPSGIGYLQHHHATIHTRDGWLRLLPETTADAHAAPHRLMIESDGAIKLEISGAFPVTFETNTEPSSEDLQGRTVLTFDADGPTSVIVGV
jgi:hypothetical protein